MVPETLHVHLIVDNYATHKHPRVKRWLAARPRFHVQLHSDLCLVAESGDVGEVKRGNGRRWIGSVR
jgi:hypothetical protein